jgi:hypothetical protein
MFPHKISINQRAAAGKLPLLEPMCREKHRKVALIRICEGYGKKKYTRSLLYLCLLH